VGAEPALPLVIEVGSQLLAFTIGGPSPSIAQASTTVSNDLQNRIARRRDDR